YLLLLLLLVVPLVLLGCSGKTDTSEEGAAESAEVATEETDDTKDADQTTESEEDLTGGQLNFAFSAQPPRLDPQENTDTETRDITLHMYEPLLSLNSSLEVEPMLAESYEVSDDGSTITFYLREGIEFHNGQEMTADDVIASMERWHELSSQAKTYLDST